MNIVEYNEHLELIIADQKEAEQEKRVCFSAILSGRGICS